MAQHSNHADMKEDKSKSKTIVIKLGSSSIIDTETLHIKLSTIAKIVEVIVALRGKGHRCILVTSGAVAVGLRRLSLKRRPKHVSGVQAVAAVGQGRLMALYDDLFGQFDVPIAQILLTKDNLAERSQYLNACNTFRELLDMSVLPIVNENDTVCNAEIRFGDNDTLSAISAGMVNANFLFLLTDVDCLYTDNPSTNPDAEAIRQVDDIAELRTRVDVSSSGSSLGTGGMDLATAVGCATIISSGTNPDAILEIIAESALHSSKTEPFIPSVGTLFTPKANPITDRKWWILNGLASYGEVYIDAGAVVALNHKNSLFASGIVKVTGTFNSQQSVKIVVVLLRDGTPEDQVVDLDDIDHDSFEILEIGKGIANYTVAEVSRVMGCKSNLFVERLGYMDSDYVCHRDNLIITEVVDLKRLATIRKM